MRQCGRHWSRREHRCLRWPTRRSPSLLPHPHGTSVLLQRFSVLQCSNWSVAWACCSTHKWWCQSWHSVSRRCRGCMSASHSPLWGGSSTSSLVQWRWPRIPSPCAHRSNCYMGIGCCSMDSGPTWWSAGVPQPCREVAPCSRPPAICPT